MLEIIDWIDKELKEITPSKLFIKYFEGKEITKDEMDYYICNEKKGIDIVISNDFKINTIHLFGNKTPNYKQFEDRLPCGIKFSFNRADIQNILGKPNKNGGGQMSLYLGNVPIWDKYYFETYTLHFQYSKNSLNIDMVTIASFKLEEYFNSKLQ